MGGGRAAQRQCANRVRAAASGREAQERRRRREHLVSRGTRTASVRCGHAALHPVRAMARRDLLCLVRSERNGFVILLRVDHDHHRGVDVRASSANWPRDDRSAQRIAVQPLLDAAGLAVRLGKVFRVGPASFAIGAGLVHVVGPNGGGKTTLAARSLWWPRFRSCLGY